MLVAVKLASEEERLSVTEYQEMERKDRFPWVYPTSQKDVQSGARMMIPHTGTERYWCREADQTAPEKLPSVERESALKHSQKISYWTDTSCLHQTMHLKESPKALCRMTGKWLTILTNNSFPHSSQSIRPRRLPESRPHKHLRMQDTPDPWGQNEVAPSYLPHKNIQRFLVSKTSSPFFKHSSAS